VIGASPHQKTRSSRPRRALLKRLTKKNFKHTLRGREIQRRSSLKKLPVIGRRRKEKLELRHAFLNRKIDPLVSRRMRVGQKKGELGSVELRNARFRKKERRAAAPPRSRALCRVDPREGKKKGKGKRPGKKGGRGNSRVLLTSRIRVGR